jgi:glycosyltransferase involved in cell wall biosynthesis
MKGGLIQTLFLFCLIPVFKLFGVKIIWTMHNKLSHSGKYPFQTKAIFKLMLRNAYLILTHSTEGLNFGADLNEKSVKNTHYLPHPVKDRRLRQTPEKEHDILIWGTISPYKGIDKFLEFLYQQKLEKKYKIYIVGKVSSTEYLEKLQQFASDNIQIENTFIEDELLRDLISKSKLILFTYSKASILSSGVLMDSLGYGANVLGPNVGAFSDLAKDGIIDIYQDFEEMAHKLESQIKNSTAIRKKSLDNFLVENSWEKYADNVHQILEKAK